MAVNRALPRGNRAESVRRQASALCYVGVCAICARRTTPESRAGERKWSTVLGPRRLVLSIGLLPGEMLDGLRHDDAMLDGMSKHIRIS